MVDAPKTREGSAGRRWPVLALGVLVVVAVVAYSAAAQLVEAPLVNPDELRYTIAAGGVVDGDGLNLRGHEYGYGPVYPLVLAPIIWLSGSVEDAYPLFKVANAFLFALAAVPIYFLARRLLAPWWSFGVATASIAIPSSIYTSLVFTENAAYLVSLALLAVVLVLERPSVPRQLGMLAAVGLATATRPQFASLVFAFLAAWLLLWAIELPRPPLRHAAARLWPTFVGVAAAGAIVGARLLLNSSTPEDELGPYGDLWRGYDPAEVARFVVYQLAGWELYLFVVPFVVAPIVVANMLRSARAGVRIDGAFVAMFLTVNALLLLITAAFASSPWGYSQLHDRYFFYVAPLWLTAFGIWLSRGLPRPLVWTTLGVALGLVLPAVLPFGLIGGNIVFEVVPTAFWTWVWNLVEGTPHFDGRRVLGVVVVVLTAVTVVLPRRFWPVLPALVAAGLLYASVLAWDREVDAPLAFVLADPDNRAWVDDAIPDGSVVTKLYVSPQHCPYTELTRHALFLTEFFNTSVDRVAEIGNSTPDGLPQDRVERGPEGQLLLTDGTRLVARYVVTPPELELVGTPLARDTGADLVLWKTRGPVTLVPDTPDDLAPAQCG
jgi:hypothetical protein